MVAVDVQDVLLDFLDLLQLVHVVRGLQVVVVLVIALVVLVVNHERVDEVFEFALHLVRVDVRPPKHLSRRGIFGIHMHLAHQTRRRHFVVS